MRPHGRLVVLAAVGLCGCPQAPSDDDGADTSESTETGNGEICDGETPGPDIVISGPNDFEDALGLECIPGTLLIVDENVDSLLGLEPLTAIGTLEIRNTLALESLAGLQNVTRIDTFVFRANRNLEDLSDLTALEEIGRLSVVNNDGLVNLEGLEAITELDELTIHSNENLVSFTGLDNLTVAGSASLIDNVTITDLSGLGGLVTVEGDLDINENLALTTVDGIGVQSVGGELEVKGNPLLCEADAEAWADSINVTGPKIIFDNLQDCIP